MRAAVADFGQRRVAIARGSGSESLVSKDARHQITNICFVIDNQNVTCHGSRLCCQLPVAASIFVWFSVASAGCVVSVTGDFLSSPSSLPSAFGAWPDVAKRSR